MAVCAPYQQLCRHFFLQPNPLQDARQHDIDDMLQLSPIPAHCSAQPHKVLAGIRGFTFLLAKANIRGLKAVLAAQKPDDSS